VPDARGTRGRGRQSTAVPPSLRVQRSAGGGGGGALSDETLVRLERKWVLILFLISSVQTKLGVVSTTQFFFSLFSFFFF
jgi:hypothetical protein